MSARDRFPEPLGPREPSAAPTLNEWLVIAAVFCGLGLFLWALPDLAAWFSTWRWPW